MAKRKDVSAKSQKGVKRWIKRKDGITQRYWIKNLKGFKTRYKKSRKRSKTGATVNEAREQFKKYIYLLSFDYASPRSKNHDIHVEVRVESPDEMTKTEINDFVLKSVKGDDSIKQEILPITTLKVKGVEIIETSERPTRKAEILSWKH